MGAFSRLGNDLYTGHRSVDFVRKRLVWYLVSVLLVLSASGVVLGKGLDFGIEFTGGTQYTVSVPADQDTVDELREVVADSGLPTGDPTVATVGDNAVSVQVKKLDNDTSDQLIALIAEQLGVAPNDVNAQEIGASLSEQLAQRSIIGVAVFLALVALLMAVYFREWKMSVAALIALAHDLVFTVGVYAAVGFAVTPAAVTGLLAILGFSLYDTVVVFDKVRENTKHLSQTKMSYAEAANLAVNQTVVRSTNTAVVALLPIGAILYVSAVQLGATSLQDLALAQFVGSGVGLYSSVMVAPRVLVHMKSRESEVKLAERRAKARARRDTTDPYASVPAFAEDMAIRDDPGVAPEPDESDPERGGDRDDGRGEPRKPEAAGKGRVAPEARRPLNESNSSGRQQPSREPKSRRKR